MYNFHRAKDEARRVDTIIIMEGFMDVIRAYTVGIKNVVATMGTAVTKNQALLIKRMAKMLYFVSMVIVLVARQQCHVVKF